MANLDVSLLEINIIASEVKQQAKILQKDLIVQDDESKLQDLLLAIELIDLTTLAGDDSFSNVGQLCFRAQNPLSQLIVKNLSSDRVGRTVGAVCVYPQRVIDCRKCLSRMLSKIPIASVVAGFPSGQSSKNATLDDITLATESGATEIDIVIERSLVLTNNWQKLFDDIKMIAQHCQQLQVHLKVILSCGELGNLQNVYKASMCAMMAGANFIKTSTGKESINAKLVYGLVMARAIFDYHLSTGVQVGLKPAGGIKTVQDALCWINLVRLQLGEKWLTNRLFRIGASSLLNNIEMEIFRLIFHRNPMPHELSF